MMRRGVILAIVAWAAAFPATAAAADGTVQVGNLFRFTPAEITINQGNAVTWTAVGPDINHVVRSDPGQADSFDSNPGVVSHSDTTGMPLGATFSHTFNTIGTFTYICFHHFALMKGKVVVLAADGSPTSPSQTSPGSSTGPSGPGAPGQVNKQTPSVGRATLRRSKAGCVSRTLSAAVNGAGIRKVVFRIDGRRVRTVWKKDGHGRYLLRADVARLRSGVHDLTARTIFSKASNTGPETDTLTFQRCARQTAGPKFTG